MLLLEGDGHVSSLGTVFYGILEGTHEPTVERILEG